MPGHCFRQCDTRPSPLASPDSITRADARSLRGTASGVGYRLSEEDRSAFCGGIFFRAPATYWPPETVYNCNVRCAAKGRPALGARSVGGSRWAARGGADRQHACGSAPLRSWRKRGAHARAIGTSRGGCDIKPVLSNCVQALRYLVLFLTMSLSVMRSFRMVATIVDAAATKQAVGTPVLC